MRGRSASGGAGTSDDYAAAVDTKVAAEHDVDRLGIRDVLLLQDARGQRMFVIARVHRHRALDDDRTVVEMLVDEMHGAAADFDSVFERLPLRVEAGKRGQQRRMNIKDAI